MALESHAWVTHATIAADHFVANDPLLNRVVAREALSWLQVYVNGKLRYQPFIAPDLSTSRFSHEPPARKGDTRTTPAG